MKIIESPRDAMQGIKRFIPTEKKAEYINDLLKVGFDIIDFGSFVSPKAIPQLSDTGKVVRMLDMSQTSTELLAVIGNFRGAEQACKFDKIGYLGYPFSISETFLRLNLNSNFQKSFDTIKNIQELCIKKEKKLLIYISLAFGNTYGDPWSINLLEDWTGKIADLGVINITLSDFIGFGEAETIHQCFQRLDANFSDLELGFHLHTRHIGWQKKLEAAYNNNCMVYDGVLNGLGGCPMSNHELVANIQTGLIIDFLRQKGEKLKINNDAFIKAAQKAQEVFPSF